MNNSMSFKDFLLMVRFFWVFHEESAGVRNGWDSSWSFFQSSAMKRNSGWERWAVVSFASMNTRDRSASKSYILASSVKKNLVTFQVFACYCYVSLLRRCIWEFYCSIKLSIMYGKRALSYELLGLLLIDSTTSARNWIKWSKTLRFPSVVSSLQN